jgi:hypothetical protein
VEQELSTILVQTCSLPLSRDRVAPVFSGVRVTRSVILCVCFVDRCLSFWPLSSGHCAVCSSSSYGFRLPHWNLEILLRFLWRIVVPSILLC